MRHIFLGLALCTNLLVLAQPTPDKGYFKRYLHPLKSNFSTQLGVGFAGINGSRYSLVEPKNQNYFLNPHVSLGLGYQYTHYVGFLFKAGYFMYGGAELPGMPGRLKGNALEAQFALKHYFLPLGDFDDQRSVLNPYALLGVGVLRTNAKGAAGGEVPGGGSEAGKWAMQLPLGLGLEYRLSERYQMGLEVSYHFTDTNALDAAVLSEKRTYDHYATLGLNILYRIHKKQFNYQQYLKSITKPF